MSLEHPSSPEEGKKYQPQNALEQKKYEQRIARESSDLREKLAQDISAEFGIDIHDVQKLISWETSEDLSSLKSGIDSTKNNINTPKLKEAIKIAQNKIEDLSKLQRDSLKDRIDPYPFIPKKSDYHASNRFFSKDFMWKIEHPQWVFDELLWAGVGIIDSVEATGIFAYNVVKWIVVSPYDMYKIITKKATYKNISKL